MKKHFTCSLMLTALCLSMSAQSLLPTPALKYDCNVITNGYEVAPTVGSITAVVTNGTSATTYKTDAVIETDAERGQVLYLPNTVDGSGKGDGAEYFRSLRINSASSLVGTGDYTISFWTKVKTQTTFNAFPAIFDFDGMSSGRSFSMRTSAWWSSNKPSLRFNDGSNKDLNLTADAATFIYDWTHYVIVKKGTTLSLYVNSSLKAQNTTYNLANTELKNLRFNGQAHGGGSLLDDIQIFTEALNIDQILELNAGAVVAPISTILDTFEDTDVHHLALGSKWAEPTLFSSAPEIGTNESKSGINTSDKVYKATNIADAGWWGNFGELQLDAPITISNENRFLKFSAYRSIQPKEFRVAINGDHEKEVFIGKLSQDATWENVVVDLGKYLGEQLTSIVIVFSTNWSAPTSGWGEALYMFDNFELSNNTSTPISVTAEAFPAIGGTITGAGVYQPGTTISLTATPSTGYSFAFWTLPDGTQISTNATYTEAVTLSTEKTVSYIAYFTKDGEVHPQVDVDGQFFEIDDLAIGKQLFRNRSNMDLKTIPSDFSGWKFIRISARADYNPIGNPEPPVYKVKPATDGYIYAMVDKREEPANAESWATTEGWELLPVYTGSYGSAGIVTFYRKYFTASASVNMVFPDVFSRALLIAPNFNNTTVGIDDVSVNKEVVAKAIYSLSGTLVSSSVSEELKEGAYIVKTSYSDGSTNSKKVIITNSK